MTLEEKKEKSSQKRLYKHLGSSRIKKNIEIVKVKQDDW